MSLIALSSNLMAGLVRAFRLSSEVAEQNELLRHLIPYNKRGTIGGNVTLVAADDNTLFTVTAAATITLPAKELGWRARFLQTADANMILASTGIIGDNTVVGITVTYSTSSHKKGSYAEVECIDVSGTLKWAFRNLGDTAAVVADS